MMRIPVKMVIFNVPSVLSNGPGLDIEGNKSHGFGPIRLGPTHQSLAKFAHQMKIIICIHLFLYLPIRYGYAVCIQTYFGLYQNSPLSDEITFD